MAKGFALQPSPLTTRVFLWFCEFGGRKKAKRTLGLPGFVDKEDEDEETRMARARMWEKRSILGIRQGGNGMAQILGVWENNVPHGKGKATFVMGRDYDKDNDPFKWDM